MMNRKSKRLVTLGSSALAVVFVFAQIPDNHGSEFCSCPQDVDFAAELPMSHPINRCASAQIAEVSWASWFSGQSNSNQFHFLDLLELLSRHNDSDKDKNAASGTNARH